jgi:hypothetical protein
MKGQVDVKHQLYRRSCGGDGKGGSQFSSLSVSMTRSPETKGSYPSAS